MLENTTMKRALYPGSFDPVTQGHLDLVRRGLLLFDQVTVAVARNSSKKPLFSMEERIAMVQAELPADTEVVPLEGLVVEYARKNGFHVILRGLRTIADFEFEYQMALTNRHLNPKVETVFVMPSVQYSYISSSLIKDVVRNGGDVSAFVTPAVESALRERLAP